MRAHPTGARLDDMPNQSAPDMRNWLEQPVKRSCLEFTRVSIWGDLVPSSVRKWEIVLPTKYPVVANGALRCRGRRRGALSHRVAANLRARALAPVIREIWAEGFMSYNAVARELNRRAVPTLRGGKQWYPMTAGRVLVRLERARLIHVRRPPARRSLLQPGSRE